MVNTYTHALKVNFPGIAKPITTLEYYKANNEDKRMLRQY